MPSFPSFDGLTLHYEDDGAGDPSSSCTDSRATATYPVPSPRLAFT